MRPEFIHGGDRHSIQLSYECVVADFTAVCAAVTKRLGMSGWGEDWVVDSCRPIDLTRSRNRVSDVIVSMRVRCIHNRRRKRSRVRPTCGIHARNHSLRLADRNALPGALGFGGGLRPCRPRERISETAAVAAEVRRWRHVCQSLQNRKSSNFVALSGYGMSSETPCTATI